jgi:hypothetical protein
MGTSVLTALLGLLGTTALLVSSIVLYRRRRSTATRLLVTGAGLFVVVVLAHISIAFQILATFGRSDPDGVLRNVAMFAAALGAILVVWGELLLYFRASPPGGRSAHEGTPSNNRWRGREGR